MHPHCLHHNKITKDKLVLIKTPTQIFIRVVCAGMPLVHHQHSCIQRSYPACRTSHAASLCLFVSGPFVPL